MPGGGEVVDHRLGDDLVVFDDQDLGHTGIIAEDAFAELRVGFTAAVSHELRTPLARLLALLDNASLPDADTEALLEQARQEVEAMAELVDDVLFLSELETGRAVVGLGDVAVAPIVRDVVEAMTPSAERHAQELVTLVAEDVVVEMRPRMLRVLVENLADERDPICR